MRAALHGNADDTDMKKQNKGAIVKQVQGRIGKKVNAYMNFEITCTVLYNRPFSIV